MRINRTSVSIIVAIVIGLVVFITTTATSEEVTLIGITDSTLFGSPDPSGLTYFPDTSDLLLSDSEVEEEPGFWTGSNLFELNPPDSLLAGSSTRGYSNEPTGVTYNTVTGTLFISDDDRRRVYEVHPLNPEQLLTSFSTSSFGSGDPEGITYNPMNGNLFITDGVGRTVFEVTIDGSLVSSFTVPSEVRDPEGIYFDSRSGNLYLVSGRGAEFVYKVSTSGNLVDSIDLRPFGVRTPKGITLAPSSDPYDDPSVMHMYVADYGTDQVNDGLLFETTIAGGGIGPNTPPRIDSGPTATPNPLLSDQTAQLSVVASDADGDPLSYSWSVPPGDGTTSGTGDTVTYTPPAVTQPQTFTITVAVTDGRGGSDTAAVNVPVEPSLNTPPQIDFGPTAAPSQIFSNETSQLSVLASDPDGDPLTFDWSVPVGEGFIAGTGDTVTYTPPAVTQVQTFTSTVTVTDDQGGSTTAPVNVTVEPVAGGGGSEVTFTVVADTYVDSRAPTSNFGTSRSLKVDGSPTRITYLRFNVSGLSGAVLSARLQFEVSNRSPSGGTVHSVPENGWGETTLIFNNRPAIGPALDTLGQVNDGDIVEFDVSSAVGGNGIYSFAMVSAISNGASYRSKDAGSIYPPMLKISTDEGGLPNTPPQIDSGPTATPNPLLSDQTAQLSVVASDADGDPLSYSWSVPPGDGTTTGTGDTVTYTPPAVTQPQTFTITVAVTDGRGGSDTAAVSVPVEPSLNTPPQITSGPTAAPSQIFSDQTAQLSVQASDPDGDPLTYAWSVGQGTISGTGGTVTYSPPAVTQAQTFTITVTVADDQGGSATAPVNVTVDPVAGGGGSELTFTPVADTWVNGSAPTSNFGTSSALEVDGSPTKIIYLRFNVGGLSGTVQSARLQFEVTNRSRSGGAIYRVLNNSWEETTLTFNNRPAIDGPALDTLGQVEVGNIVEFNLGSAVGGNGIYSFAIVSTASNGADYRSREDLLYPPTLTVVSN